MSIKRLRMINPLICDGEPYQTTVNCRAVLHFLSPALHENPTGDDEEFGRYLILETIRAALADVQRCLEPVPVAKPGVLPRAKKRPQLVGVPSPPSAA